MVFDGKKSHIFVPFAIFLLTTAEHFIKYNALWEWPPFYDRTGHFAISLI